MECSGCGAHLQDKTLYCPVCGEEILWVPEYATIETLMYQHQMKIDTDHLKHSGKKIKCKGFLAGGIVLLLVMVLAVNIYKYNSFDYQMSLAEAAYSDQNYEQALNYADRALSINSDGVEATLMIAKIFTAQGNIRTAIPILEAAVKNNSGSIKAYGQLIQLYEDTDQLESIKDLMAQTEEEDILNEFSDYLCEVPEINLDSGTYKKKILLALSPKRNSDSIYYTTNGSTPTSSSSVYTDAIAVGEGTITIKAIAMNKKGISSDVLSETYTIIRNDPEMPEVWPKSGEYREGERIVVTVPDDCTAYYAFDESPTVSSKKYSSSVAMEKGEHIFSVIVVDKEGKTSNAASETYVVY